MTDKNMHEVLRALGWWLVTAENSPQGPGRFMLAGPWHDLCALVARREGVSVEEADDLLSGGYLARWVKQLIPAESRS